MAFQTHQCLLYLEQIITKGFNNHQKGPKMTKDRQLDSLLEFSKDILVKIERNNEPAHSLKHLFKIFYRDLGEIVNQDDRFFNKDGICNFGSFFVLISYAPCSFTESDRMQLIKDHGLQYKLDHPNPSTCKVEQKKMFEIYIKRNKDKEVDIQFALYQKRMVNCDGLTCNYYASFWENDYCYSFEMDEINERCDRLIKDMTLYDFLLCKDYMNELIETVRYNFKRWAAPL